MNIEKGQKYIVIVEKIGCGNDNSTLFSDGNYMSEEDVKEALSDGKLISVSEYANKVKQEFAKSIIDELNPTDDIENEIIKMIESLLNNESER